MFTCEFCGREAKNNNSNVQHTIRCNSNPNKIEQPNRSGKNNPMYGKKGTNQFISGTMTTHSQLTKDKLKLANTGKRHTQHTKDKLSKIRTQYLIDNPDKVPYVLNHYSKGRSYPEVYWKSILDNNNITYIQEHRIHLYSLDFAILDKKIDLEIDGSQHYNDDRVIASDIKRTKYLEENGWTVIRVNWSEYIKLNNTDRIKYVNSIIKLVK